MNDLVSYNYKHNEANGENNRDGIAENFSFNYGTEGPYNALLSKKHEIGRSRISLQHSCFP